MSRLCNYTIRSAQLEDCNVLAQMINESSEGAVDYIYDHGEFGRSSIDILEHQLMSGVHYSYVNSHVVEINNTIVAMVLSFPANGLVLDAEMLANFAPEKQEYLNYFINNRILDCWHLDAIYVCGAYRNLGLGSNLLKNLKMQACEYNFPSLEVFVFATNESAIRFYERNDFVIDKKIDITKHDFLSAKKALFRMSCQL